MNSPEKNDVIEKLLREQDAYISDEGFTKGVLARLPRRRRRWMPRVILLAMVAGGALMASQWVSWSSLPPLDYRRVIELDSGFLSAWLPVAAVGAALVSALVAALRGED